MWPKTSNNVSTSTARFNWLKRRYKPSTPHPPEVTGALKQDSKEFALVLLAGMALCTSSASFAHAAPPTAEVVQVVLAGQNGLPKSFDPSGLFSMGDYLYAVGPPRKPGIHYFKRDASTGLLAYAGTVVVAQPICDGSMVIPVGRRLYLLQTRSGDNRIVWYDVDVKTGKPEEMGVSPKLTWTDRPDHTGNVSWRECWSRAATRRTST